MFKKVLIVDDEDLVLDRLERILKKLGIEEVHRSSDYYTALNILKEDHEIKVVFLDIRMPGKTGLELAQKIREERDDIAVIIQTAYDEYALAGYRVGAIDYLVKPYTIEDVEQALERAKKMLGEENEKYILVETTTGANKILNLKEVNYIKADLKNSLLRTKEGFFFCRLSLGELERKTQKFGFLRIHRSYLINLSKVKAIENGPFGKLIITFKDEVEPINTSKSGAKLIRDTLKRLKNT